MKKIIFFLFLLPVIVFGQTGKIISNKPTGGTIIGDTLKIGSLNLKQTTAGKTISLGNYTSGPVTVDIANNGTVAVTMNPGGFLDTASRFTYRWTGTKWTASAGGYILDTSAVHKTGNEVIRSGIKTFVVSPSVPTPTLSADAANKGYVDTQAAAKQDTGLAFYKDGSKIATGDFDLNSHDLKRVTGIKDPSGVYAFVPSTRLLKDVSGNTILNFQSQSNGIGIGTGGSGFAYFKADNLTTNRTLQAPNQSGIIAVTTDIPSTSAKLDTSLAYGEIWIGSSFGGATQRTISGDFTISNSGVGSIGNNKVTDAMLLSTYLKRWSLFDTTYTTSTLLGGGRLSVANFNIFNNKQDALVSGTNIKTVNSSSLLGSGNLSVGTVTSVGMTGDNVIYNTSVTGSPITTSGTFVPTLKNASANTFVRGPTSGSPSPWTAGGLVNADLPTGTQTLLPELGTIITEPWTNLTAWTTSGSPGASVSGGTLTLAGGTPGSVTLTNYIKNTGYGNTMYMAWTATYNITVGTINSTSWGVGFGIQGNGGYVSTGVQVGILLDATNKGLIKIYGNNSNTVLATSDVALSVTAGDVLSVKVKRIYNSIQCTVTNTTISPNNSVTLSVDQVDISTGTIIPNVGQFSFYSMGGTHTVSALNVSCNQKIGIDLLCIGDSRTNGSQASVNNNYVGLLGEMINGYVDSYAGSGCVNSDYIAAEILALAPKNITVLSGLNNVIGLGNSAATTTTQLQTLLNSLISGGYVLGTNLFYLDELPCTSGSLTTLSSTYKSTIGVTGCIYTYTSFLFSGFSPNPLYYYTDGTHPIDIGHKKLAQLIEAQLPSGIGKRNKVVQSTIKPYYRKNGQVIFGNANFSPRFAIEAVATPDLGNTSQIHVTNSGAGVADFTGGYISSTTSNQLALYGGYYFLNSVLTASATSGSGVGVNNGGLTFQYFSGATVGNAVTPSNGAFMSNSGNWFFGGSSTATSTVQVGGSFAQAYIAKTANYTLTATDYLVDCTANSFNITLPTAVGIQGRVYEIVNSGAGTITILTTSSQVFANVSGTPTSLSLATATAKSIKVMSNGANWIQLN